MAYESSYTSTLVYNYSHTPPPPRPPRQRRGEAYLLRQPVRREVIHSVIPEAGQDDEGRRITQRHLRKHGERIAGQSTLKHTQFISTKTVSPTFLNVLAQPELTADM